MVDRIRPLKFEDPSTGGTETDQFPTGTNPNEDFVDSRGTTYQDDSSDDDLVRISRDGNDLTFLDINNTVKTLSDLVSGTGGLTVEAHKIIRHIIHFMEEGPAEGSYKESAWSGILPTNETWWETSSKIDKIYEVNYTYTGINPTTIERKIYDTDGDLLVTVTDTVTYSGILEDTRTRVVT